MSRRDSMLRLAPPPAARGRKKKAAKKIVGISFLLACLGLLLYYGHALFQIKEVVVTGTCRLEPSEVISASGIREGTSIWLIRKKSAAGRLMLLPSVSGVSVTRHLPATIVIEILEREPAAYLVCGNQFWMVDRDGVVFGVSRSLESGLPVVTGVPEDEILTGLPVGSRARAEALETFLNALEFIPELDVAELNLENPFEMMLYTVDGKKILLGGSEKMEHKLMLVWQSMPHLAGTSQSTRLDVRSGNMVITGTNLGPGEVAP